MTGDTLVRVSADLSGIGEAKCTPGSYPLVEQIAREPFAQLNLGRLVQPGVCATFRTKRAPAMIQKITSWTKNPWKSLCCKAL
jgi:hypothetical protein